MAKLYFKIASDWEEVVRLRNEIAKLKQELKNMDSTQSPAAFKALNTQLSASTQRMDELVNKAAQAGAVMEGDFRKKIFDASQTVNGFTEKIIAQKNAIGSLQTSIRKNKELYRTITSRGNEDKGLLNHIREQEKALGKERDALFNLTQAQANARLSVKKLRDEYSLYKNDGKQVVETNQNIGLSLGKALGVIGGVAALKQLGSEIIRVRGEFQSMQTAIETMVGKDMAGQLIPQIKELAKISPLTMSDMVGAEKMMLGFNIQAEDTIKYLKAISDISMGESGKFNSLTLAFSQMSAAGKLMGQDLNQMINAGFNPLQVIAEKTGKSIATLKEEMSKGAVSAEMVQQAFIDVTSAGGKFFGMSENASKTINGQISMMQDALDNALNEIGKSSEGFIMSGIQATTSLIQNYETIGKILVGMIATYGVYKTALITNITLTRGWAVAARADAVAKGIQTIATKAQTVAQLALNSAMRANPYVLAATLIMGAASAMWAFRDSTTAAEKGVERYNEEQGKAARLEAERKQKIDGLVQSSRDIALSDLQRGQSLAELRKEYPKIFAQYDIETIKLADILKLKQQIAEEDAKRVGERVARDFEAANKAVSDYETTLTAKQINGGKLTQQEINKLKELRSVREQFLVDRGSPISEQFISGLKDVDIDKFDRYISELEKRIKGKGENGKVKLRLPIDAKGSLSDEAIYDVKDIKTLIDTTKAAKKTKEEAEKAEKKSSAEWLASYKKAYEDAEKAYKDFLMSKEVMSDADRDKELKRLKGLRDTAKATYESKGGLISYDTKQEKQAENLRKEQEKYNLLASRQELERIRTSEDLENQVSQSKIDAMSNGFEKEQAQRELNNKKEIQSLQRQKEDYIRTYVQAQKDLSDAREELNSRQTKGYVKKSFDPSSVSVDTSAFDTIIDNTAKRQQNDKLHEQEDSWDEYLIKYGTFQGKKAALTRKYQKLIDEEPDAGKAAALQKELEEALSALDVDKLKQEINWELVFGDLSKVSKKELDKVNVQLKKFRKSSEYQNMAVEQKKVIDEALDSIQSAIIDKGGILGDLPGQLDNLRKAQEELEKAQDEYNDSLKNGTLAEQEAAKKKQNTAEQNVVNAEANANKSSQKAIDNITGVTNAITQLGEADMSLSEFGNAVGSLVDALSQSGSRIGGIIAAILSLLDQFSEDGGVQFGKNLLENVANAIGGTIEVPFKMLGIDLGLGGADYSGYNEMVAQYDNLLEIWDELLDKKKAYIKESYGAEAAKAGEEALDIAKNELEVQRKLAAERLSAGSSAGSHSQWYRMWKGSYKWEGKNWRDVAGEIEKQLKDADLGDVNFDSMDSMTKMTSEQLQWIKENYAGLWSAMDGEFRDHLNNIIQYGDTEKDIIESIQEQLTQTTFDSVYDSFVDKLMDMKASASDFSDDLNEMFMRSLLSDEMGTKYYDKLKGWYAKWSEAMKLEDETRRKLELDSLREEYESYVDSAIQERNDLADTIGYTGDSSSSSQSAASKGFQTMSQDTGEELNGRFTALQTAGEEVKNQSVLQSQSLNLLTARADTILSVNTETRNIADETRTILANSYLELVQISENTGAIIKPIQQMQKDMAEVKNNTKGLSSR